jgi:hypothetical protein
MRFEINSLPVEDGYRQVPNLILRQFSIPGWEWREAIASCAWPDAGDASFGFKAERMRGLACRGDPQGTDERH